MGDRVAREVLARGDGAGEVVLRIKAGLQPRGANRLRQCCRRIASQARGEGEVAGEVRRRGEERARTEDPSAAGRLADLGADVGARNRDRDARRGRAGRAIGSDRGTLVPRGWCRICGDNDRESENRSDRKASAASHWLSPSSEVCAS